MAKPSDRSPERELHGSRFDANQDVSKAAAIPPGKARDAVRHAKNLALRK